MCEKKALWSPFSIQFISNNKTIYLAFSFLLNYLNFSLACHSPLASMVTIYILLSNLCRFHLSFSFFSLPFSLSLSLTHTRSSLFLSLTFSRIFSRFHFQFALFRSLFLIGTSSLVSLDFVLKFRFRCWNLSFLMILHVENAGCRIRSSVIVLFKKTIALIMNNCSTRQYLKHSDELSFDTIFFPTISFIVYIFLQCFHVSSFLFFCSFVIADSMMNPKAVLLYCIYFLLL